MAGPLLPAQNGTSTAPVWVEGMGNKIIMTKEQLQKELKTKEKDLRFYRELVSYILTTFLTEEQLERVREHMAGEKLKKIIYKS